MAKKRPLSYEQRVLKQIQKMERKAGNPRRLNPRDPDIAQFLSLVSVARQWREESSAPNAAPDKPQVSRPEG